MKILKPSEAKEKLEEYSNYVLKTHSPVVIKLEGGKEVAIISMQDYQVLDETAYLLACAQNREKLQQAIEDISKDKFAETFSSVSDLRKQFDIPSTSNAGKMEIKFTAAAKEDFEYFVHEFKDIAGMICSLLDEIEVHPAAGSGRPEALKHDLIGFWSRRITIEHRIIYKIVGSSIIVAACRFHYK